MQMNYNWKYLDLDCNTFVLKYNIYVNQICIFFKKNLVEKLKNKTKLSAWKMVPDYGFRHHNLRGGGLPQLPLFAAITQLN